MYVSSKLLVSLAAVSAALSAASFWWWTRLMGADFATCVAQAVPVGVDCRHDTQFYVGLALAAFGLALLSAATVRYCRAAMAARHAA